MRGAFERDFITKVVLYAQAQERRDMHDLRAMKQEIVELKAQLAAYEEPIKFVEMFLLPFRVILVLFDLAMRLLIIVTALFALLAMDKNLLYYVVEKVINKNTYNL